MSGERSVTVGVLALQGAFQEHIQRFSSLNASSCMPTVRAVAVRKPEQLERCDALVIPGGESTAISLGMRNAHLDEPLRAWIAEGKPVWGTCAGMIMLAMVAQGGKMGGQELLGGLDIQVGRNGFGSQVNSFEASVLMPALGDEPFDGVFIRAPIVQALLDQAGHVRGTPEEKAAARVSTAPTDVRRGAAPPPLEVLGWLPQEAVPSGAQQAAEACVWEPTGAQPPIEVRGPRPPSDTHIVAVRQGNLLATSFHPELTTDTRLHAYFVNMVKT